MQTLDFVSGLHSCQKFSQLVRLLISGSIRLCKQRKKVFYCFYKITFRRKKKNSLFRLLVKREILTSREVLYTKLNVLLICSCFAIKMLSKKIFQVSSAEWMGKVSKFVESSTQKYSKIRACVISLRRAKHLDSTHVWSSLDSIHQTDILLLQDISLFLYEISWWNVHKSPSVFNF